MLEKYDPGLITGTIGAVIGIVLASIFEKSKIVHRFSKLRENLKGEVDGLNEKPRFATESRVFDNMQDLVQEGSEMVGEQRVDVPPWYCVIRRYRESNEMAKLISKIETTQSLLGQTFYLERILIYHREESSHLLQTLTSHQEQTSHLLQTEQTSSLLVAVAQTYTAEEMTDEENPMPAVLRRRVGISPAISNAKTEQTSSAETYTEEMTNEEKPMPAVLRRRVGISPAISNVTSMVVIKLMMMYHRKNKKTAFKAMDEAVASMAVDMKENKMTVIGDVDPVSLAEKLRKVGIAELSILGPLKEEINMPAKVKYFINWLQRTISAHIYYEVNLEAERLSKRALVS